MVLRVSNLHGLPERVNKYMRAEQVAAVAALPAPRPRVGGWESLAIHRLHNKEWLVNPRGRYKYFTFPKQGGPEQRRRASKRNLTIFNLAA